jgi:hypothetical protein
LALIGLAWFLLGAASSRWLCLALTALTLLVCLGRIWQRGAFKFTLPPWLIGALLWWCALVGMQAILPIQTNAYMYGDWWMHYDISQFYRGLRDPAIRYFDLYTIPSRTPLFNLAASYYLNVFGDSFSIYQLTAMIHGVGLFGVLGLFVRSRWGELLLLLALNSFIVTHTLYPWPKIMAASLLMASLWCYLQWRNEQLPNRRWIVASGMWAGLAVMAHTAMLVYAAAMVLDYVFLNRRRPGRSLRALVWEGPAMVLALLPWLTWVIATYDLPSLTAAAPTFAAATSGGTPASWLADRVITLLGTLIPLPWLMAGLRATGWWDAFLRYWYYTLPGACMTVGLGLWLRGRTPGDGPLPRSLVFWLVGIGLVGGVALQPGQSAHGIAGESLVPLVTIFVVLLASILSRLPSRVRLIGLGLLGSEFLLSRGLHTARLALNDVSATDQNLLLKHQKQIVFLRDQVGAAWVVYTGLVILSYALLIVWAVRSSGSNQQLLPDSPPAAALHDR